MSNKYMLEGVRISKKVRDGYLGDLPEDIQSKVMGIHKIIKDAIDDTLKKEGYEDLKSSRWAMSCIDDFGAMPKDKSDVGSIRVYKSTKGYKTDIHVTGHFTNHEYGWIEELIHDFICDVYNTVRPAVRKKYDVTITNEGKNGCSYEGFSVCLDNKTSEQLWEQFDDRKTKGITEYGCEVDFQTGDVEFVEGYMAAASEDLVTYYECYADQMSYDQYFSEKSHGKLKNEFRLVIGENDGHLYKIVYELNPGNIVSDNIDTGAGRDRLVKNIRKTGHSNYVSKGNKILAITDMSTNRRVNEVSAFPPIHNIGGNLMPMNIDRYVGIMSQFIHDDKKLDKLRKELNEECPTGIVPNPGFEAAVKKSKERGQKPIIYKVGEIDTTETYKTTNIRAVTKGMLNLESVVNTETSITESTNTPPYNVDMTETQAKRTLHTLSSSIINDFKSNRSKKVVQYTANIYANIITKNLLPTWAGSFRKFTLTLSDYPSPNTVEFKVPKMTQDFVARFIQGRENIEGFLHRQPEIKMCISPRVFNTMKEPDDAFNFFKSAIQYYDKKVGKAGSRLMAEVMRLDHSLKHLIGTTRLSGIVTYPMTLLFIFDDVDMSRKDNFELSAEDTRVVGQFVRNITSHYAAPEKEKKTIVDDVQKMVKTLREACMLDDNIKELNYLSEAVSQYYSGAFKKEMEAGDASWIKEQVDLENMRNHPDPQVHYLQEKFGVKKLKKIPADLIAYIQIETESIKDANDKMMISSYCLSKLEIVEWYIELLNVGSNKYIVPHTKPYLESVRTQLLACFKKIMDTPIPKTDRPVIDIHYPKGYEG